MADVIQWSIALCFIPVLALLALGLGFVGLVKLMAKVLES